MPYKNPKGPAIKSKRLPMVAATKDGVFFEIRDKDRTAGRIVRQKLFLETFAKNGSIAATCRQTQIDTRTHYYWLHTDLEYYNAFQQAKIYAMDALEGEVYKRAVEGWQTPFFQKGQQVGFYTQYSDKLLMFLLQGIAPEKYRENYKGERKPDIRPDTDLSKLTREELETLHAIATAVRLRTESEAGIEAPRSDEDPKLFQ